jgi:ribosome biogenesis GTPase / thiamine phosphate phosphatase
VDPLEPYGWDDAWRAELDALAQPGDYPGRISLVRRVNCDVVVATDAGVAAVTARPSPRLSGMLDGASLPAVGDWVVLTDEEDTAEPAIVAILPRRSVISRLDPADVTGEQVLATNVELLLIVHALDRDLNLRGIERALVIAMETGAVAVVVLAKADVAGPEATTAAVEQAQARLRSLDVEVFATSTHTGEGLDLLRAAVAGHRTLALMGPSGAGKSSLVNTLVGEESMSVGEVREGDSRGRHTTVTRELLPLPGGGVVIDTPGLRSIGLWDADLGVDLAFPDVFAFVEQCRFADCTHEHEPGCAVLAAVERGELDAGRVASYRDLVAELDQVDRRRTEQERQQGEKGRRPRGKQVGRRVARRGGRR